MAATREAERAARFMIEDMMRYALELRYAGLIEVFHDEAYASAYFSQN